MNQNEEFLELIKQELELLNAGKSLEELDMNEYKRLEEKLNKEHETFDKNEFYVKEKIFYETHKLGLERVGSGQNVDPKVNLFQPF